MQVDPENIILNSPEYQLLIESEEALAAEEKYLGFGFDRFGYARVEAALRDTIEAMGRLEKGLVMAKKQPDVFTSNVNQLSECVRNAIQIKKMNSLLEKIAEIRDLQESVRTKLVEFTSNPPREMGDIKVGEMEFQTEKDGDITIFHEISQSLRTYSVKV